MLPRVVVIWYLIFRYIPQRHRCFLVCHVFPLCRALFRVELFFTSLSEFKLQRLFLFLNPEEEKRRGVIFGVMPLR